MRLKLNLLINVTGILNIMYLMTFEPVHEKNYKLAQIQIFCKIQLKRSCVIYWSYAYQTFHPWSLICIYADIVQHVNLSEDMSITNGNTRSLTTGTILEEI